MSGLHPAPGMSLRDWFAGMVAQGLLAAGGDYDPSGLASDAYARADAMLSARKPKSIDRQ